MALGKYILAITLLGLFPIKSTMGIGPLVTNEFRGISIIYQVLHSTASCIIRNGKGLLWLGSEEYLAAYQRFSLSTNSTQPHYPMGRMGNGAIYSTGHYDADCWVESPQGELIPFRPRGIKFSSCPVRLATSSRTPKRLFKGDVWHSEGLGIIGMGLTLQKPILSPIGSITTNEVDTSSPKLAVPPSLPNSIWFIVLGVLSVLIVIAFIIVFRGANSKLSKVRLESMVQDRTRKLEMQSLEIQKQSEVLRQANEEITATSEALALQNADLQRMNTEFSIQQRELENQRNSLANLAWELQEKNEEITTQHNEIEAQKDLLTQQKKEITDSIRYAQRIQQAVLPTQEQIVELFPDYFILNQPKSIVSGDFYWISQIGRFRVIAVADCTGHGVPGGFMSMLGVLMLKEALTYKTAHNPAITLNQLRQSIITVLHQKGGMSDPGDGMDISLCIIDDQDNTLHYSGANSAIIILTRGLNGENQLLDIRSDRMPISYHAIMKPFSTSSYKIQKGTGIYLFTDGLIDQFGEATGRKYQLAQFRQFIQTNSSLPMQQQGVLLEQSFNSWKGNSFQVDDVLVFGVRV